MTGFCFACAGGVVFLTLILIEEAKLAYAWYRRELSAAWPQHDTDVYPDYIYPEPPTNITNGLFLLENIGHQAVHPRHGEQQTTYPGLDAAA